MIKKQLIMEKALELFAQQGFESTSVQQITDHCGISKGAFYLSFKSKDELIFALIDHFMVQFTSDIDYVVKHTTNDSQLLYNFYHTTFKSFLKHSDFAKVLIKEQTQPVNKELINKISYYDKLLEKNILTMLEQLYGEKIKDTKYDLIYCIKGFMSTYSNMFIFYNEPLDVELLSRSLVEKTNILAQHTTIPFITDELIERFQQPTDEMVSKEQIIELIDQKLEELEDSIERESLTLLKQQLTEQSFSVVIIRGLLENIRNHPHCKWIGFMLRSYWNF
jgi:AcrR family transcriptional regulator